MRGDDEKHTYTFASLSITFVGLGVPFLSEKTKETIAAMTVEGAKAANREAWKQKKENCRIANRHCNWSVSGNISIYERADHHCNVAELICKETYKRMMRG